MLAEIDPKTLPARKCGTTYRCYNFKKKQKHDNYRFSCFAFSSQLSFSSFISSFFSRVSLMSLCPLFSALSSLTSKLSLVSYLSLSSQLCFSFSFSCQLSRTALTYPAWQSAWALAHSLIGDLLALCRNKLSKCTPDETSCNLA